MNVAALFDPLLGMLEVERSHISPSPRSTLTHNQDKNTKLTTRILNDRLDSLTLLERGKANLSYL